MRRRCSRTFDVARFRCNDSPTTSDRPGFYEKRGPEHLPSWITMIVVHTDAGSHDGNHTQEQVSVDSVETLIYLAGQGCLTPHPWLSAEDDLECPDQMIFDLDPSRDDVVLVRRAARAVRDVLDDFGLESFLKTTGSRGYHVAVSRGCITSARPTL